MDSVGLTPERWVEIGISLGIVAGTLLLGRWVIAFLLGRVMGRLVRLTRTDFDNLILDTIRPSLYMLAVAVSIQIALQRLDFLENRDWMAGLFFILYFTVGFVFLWLLISNLFNWYSKEVAPRTESKLDEQMFPFFRRVALILLLIIGAVIVFGHFGVDVSALVTTLGVGSLAVALAAQATLADTIAGFVIMIDRPFRIGDRIEIQDLDTWGDVVDIGLRSSRIRTRDNRMVIVPNAVIGKSLVVNHSYPDTLYRIQIHIGVGYGSDLELARETMITAVKDVEGVSSDHPVEALLLEFGDSALIFRIRWWIDSYTDTRRMFDKVNTALYRALTQAGIDLPFPQMMVHLVRSEYD